MIFRIYDVVNSKTGQIVKVGSTQRTLQRRWKQQDYSHPKYRGFELRLAQEFFWPDDDKDFGVILCRVREQIRISKGKLWWDENGRNIHRPVEVLLQGNDAVNISSAGGLTTWRNDPEGAKQRILKARKEAEESGILDIARKKSGLINTQSGQLSKIRTAESCSKGGSIAGRNNIKSGHLVKMRHEHWGHDGPVESCLRCVGTPEQKKILHREYKKLDARWRKKHAGTKVLLTAEQRRDRLSLPWKNK